MTRGELLFVSSCFLLITVLIWRECSRPLYVTPALAEEPCLRTTSGEYDRNYPPEGTLLNRRPADTQSK